MNIAHSRTDGKQDAPDAMMAWETAQDMSVRTHCRRYRGDRHGGWSNVTYDRPMGSHPPAGPYAIYLAQDGRYWLACFDFDAHATSATPAMVQRDAAMCAGLLADHGIKSVTCLSGPGGGRHVWAGMFEAVDAPLMRRIASLMRLLTPTLDPTPLLNPATGCARPPYAPHRTGGHSLPVAGDLNDVLLPSSTAKQWQALADALRERVERQTTGHTDAPAPTASHAATGTDGHGMPWIPGPHRPLPASTRRLLDTPITPGMDASRVSWAIMCSAAACHWRLGEVMRLLDKPGMEHARSMRAGSGIRVARSVDGPHGTMRVVRDDWRRAVRFVLDHPRSGCGDDPSWDRRLADVTITVGQLLYRMQSARGRFAQGGGAADRRVLMALCRLCLKAVRTDVQANIRSLAMDCGLGRETARTSLIRLQRDGWISLTETAEGRSANRWKLDDSAVSCTARSQVNTPPAGEGPALLRERLISYLDSWLSLSSHDLHSGSALRHLSGNALADCLNPDDDPEDQRLKTSRILPLLDKAARDDGLDGVARRRKRLYETERLAWQWWLCEFEWMKARKRDKTRRTVLYPDLLRRGRFAPLPRTQNHRADWRALRRECRIMLDRPTQGALPI